MRAAFAPDPRAPLRRLACLAAALITLAAPGTAPGATPGAGEPEPPPPEKASEGIESLHAILLAAMKDADALGYAGRLEKIRPVLLDVYDFPFMAEKSIGLGWRDLDEAARARLVDAFTRLAIATYAARFDGWDGDRFETLGVQPASAGTMLVKTRIVRGSGETVALDYRMRPVEGRWRIIDVFMNGTVSELALRRAEYSGVLRRDGFDSLLKAIDEKIALRENGTAEES